MLTQTPYTYTRTGAYFVPVQRRRGADRLSRWLAVVLALAFVALVW